MFLILLSLIYLPVDCIYQYASSARKLIQYNVLLLNRLIYLIDKHLNIVNI